MTDKELLELAAKDFMSKYVASFLASYMASRYESDCANGHPLKGVQPVEDAVFLAEEAWELLCATTK